MNLYWICTKEPIVVYFDGARSAYAWYSYIVVPH